MFQHMEYIYEVYQMKSISKAAERLYISQPSLSAIIKKLEMKIGSKLFNRSTNPLTLTQSGEKYIKCVEKIMDIQNEFSNYLNDVEELKVGTINIGVSNFFAAYILPPIIAEFKALYPQIEINLIETESLRAKKLLDSGELDIIIDNRDFNEDSYERYLFSTETLILAVPVDMLLDEHKEYMMTAQDIREGRHLCSSTKSIKLDTFADFPFIALRSGNDTRDRFESMKKEHNYKPNIILELDQLATAYHVACQRLGVTITSDRLIAEAPIDHRLAFFPIESEFIDRKNHFYYKEGKYLSKAMKTFMEFSSEFAPN